jgi:protease-4
VIRWALRRGLGLLRLLLGLPVALLAALVWRRGRRDALVLRFEDAVEDHPQDHGWIRSFLGARAPGLDLATALAALREAKADPRLKGVVVLLERAALGLTQADLLATALDAARLAGKKALVWTDTTSAGALVVGAAADRFLVAPESTLRFAGVRMAAPFVGDLLRLVGLGADLDHEGPYKSYSDTFTRSSMSDAHREVSIALTTDLYDQVVSPLVVGRAIERRRIEALIDAAPSSHRAVVAEGLADKLAWEDEVDAETATLLGLDPEPDPAKAWRGVSPRYYVGRQRRRERRAGLFRDLPLIAVAELEGAIVPGKEGRGVAVHAWVELLEELADDDEVKAVVLRIDSPGGSAEASDDLWRAARLLDREKPVVASLGRVAASGGYYAAVAARRIVAHPSTLTGSIGVVSGKLHAAPLLERLGVRVEGPQVGAHAGLYDPDRPFTADERVANRRELERVYRTFLERVAEGRKKTLAEVEALAQGRVYTGRQALPLGLVDRLGGLEDALDEVRTLAELRGPARVVRVRSPRRRSLGVVPGLSFDDLGTALELARCRTLTWCPWTVRGLE